MAGGIKYPFPMKAAVDQDVRCAHMQYCVDIGVPWFVGTPKARKEEWLNVIAFGPSLYDTWERATHPMITCSGSLPFMTMREQVPDYHVDMDPREHKLRGLARAPTETQYIMASVCHPWAWKALEGRNVRAWHFWCGQQSVDWVKANDPAHDIMLAGASVGIGAVRIGMELGYRKFRIFGMDNSFKDGMRHAGAHLGAPHAMIECDTGEHGKFITSEIMTNCSIEATEWFAMAITHGGCEFELHGWGLQQALAKGSGLPKLTVVE